MCQGPILTIAVPTYNMAQWLDKNLATYCHPELEGRLEVLGLNNASTDDSRAILDRFSREHPHIFTLVDRDSRGYGSSINAALSRAKGRYFRIVDADDWVDTQQLIALVDELEHCSADVVITDYEIVNMQTGELTPVRVRDRGGEYGQLTCDVSACIPLLPSIHSTTYQTSLLRECGFYMQDNMFFVDEEYVILPYLQAKSVICYPFDVYRYQVANPAQSTSPKNRAKYLEHREKVLKRLIPAYITAKEEGQGADALAYCFERIKNGVGDHFTTLYMYVEDRKEGRRLAWEWKAYIQRQAPDFWPPVKRKERLLHILNRLHISLKQYQGLKRCLLHREG